METAWIDRVKHQMKEMGVSQVSLAKSLCCTRGAVGHYLSGRRHPNLRQLKQIAEILHIEPGWMLFGNVNNAVHETGQTYKVTNHNRSIVLRGSTKTGIGADVIGQVVIPSDPANTFALSVIGTDWAPRVHDGEILILTSDFKPQPGDELFIRYRDGHLDLQQLVRLQANQIVLETLTERRCRQSHALSDIESMHCLLAVVRHHLSE